MPAPKSKPSQKRAPLVVRESAMSDVRRAAISMHIERAALTLFAARGVEAVTVDEIAEAAGISRRTFYRYFETPDDILSAGLLRLLERWAREVKARPLEEPILTAFQEAGRNIPRPTEETALEDLARRVIRRSPEAWVRANARAQTRSVIVFSSLIAERLRAKGLDSSGASLIAAALIAFNVQAASESDRYGTELAFDRIHRAMTTFKDMVDEQARAAPRRKATTAKRKKT